MKGITGTSKYQVDATVDELNVTKKAQKSASMSLSFWRQTTAATQKIDDTSASLHPSRRTRANALLAHCTWGGLNRNDKPRPAIATKSIKSLMLFIWRIYYTIAFSSPMSSKSVKDLSIEILLAPELNGRVRIMVPTMVTMMSKYSWPPDPTKWAWKVFKNLVASKKLFLASSEAARHSFHFAEYWLSRCCKYSSGRYRSLKYFVVIAALRFWPNFSSRPYTWLKRYATDVMEPQDGSRVEMFRP